MNTRLLILSALGLAFLVLRQADARRRTVAAADAMARSTWESEGGTASLDA